MEMRRIIAAFCMTGVVCACLVVVSGCSSSAQKTSSGAETTLAQDDTTTTQPETEAITEESVEVLEIGEGFGVGFAAHQAIQKVEGIEIISGTVERVGGGMIYTPNTGSGFFTINGTVADDSEIAISIHPVSVLRYKLSLTAEQEKTVKAEIRVFKKGELLVSCVQEEMVLQSGTNDVDVCLDTGEGCACYGTYDLGFYLDGCLVAQNEYEA